jgi:hypothetical protein
MGALDVMRLALQIKSRHSLKKVLDDYGGLTVGCQVMTGSAFLEISVQ